jgi:nitrogen regulatory protein PII
MKAVMIVFNQSHSERIEYMFDRLGIRGYTWLTDVKGKGSETGEPRMGTHTWPEMNSAALVIVPFDKVDPLLESVTKLDEIDKSVGIRAFVWDITKMV